MFERHLGRPVNYEGTLMAMNFEELDDATRSYMLAEFEREETGQPYRAKVLTSTGVAAIPSIIRDALRTSNEISLAAALLDPSYWLPTEAYVRDGIVRERKVNMQQAAERLAITEFNTWYVRGLAARLLAEKVERCQAYRAAIPKWEAADCTAHEGQVYLVIDIYNGHRARYWPEPGNSEALSIPFGPGCHHTIRRWTAA